MRILVVEDYAPLRNAVVQALREEGWSVDEAADGNEGAFVALNGSYDLLVLDIMLPGMDGLKILDRLRAHGSDTHVLLLTARDTVDDRVSGLDHGADDYLVKPFAMTELLARVRALLRRKYSKKNPLLTVAHLSIDTADHTVRAAGEAVELTAREYALLEYLALRQGEVISRTEIWEHLYDDRSSASSNVVDVYIGYLRKKLTRNNQPCPIQTRRGEGYILVADAL
ncbi:MAG: DNA-binding response OmpR family regulator [Pseudohongiellaceae bacterium]|jgi:DNA-binding response OmpR family regulator